MEPFCARGRLRTMLLACSPRLRWLVLLAFVPCLEACTDAPAVSTARAAASTPAAGSARTPFVPVSAPTDGALLEVPARALVGPDSVAAIASTVPLRIVRVHVEPGDEVAAGAPIVEVASAEVLEAAARYLASTQGARAHGERLDVLRPLREEGVVPTERVFEVERRALELESAAREALAVLRAAGVAPSEVGAVLRRGTLVLRSPIAGVVRDVDAIRGAVRENGGTFAHVVGGESTRIEARFPTALPSGFRYAFEDLRGRRFDVGGAPSRTLDAGEEGGIVAWFDLAQGTGIAAGSPGHLRAEPANDAFVEVPATALQLRRGSARVLRRRGSSARPVAVEVVSTSGSAAIVSGDLRVGDMVARDGPTALESETTE